MLEFLQKELRYDHWANLETLKSVENASSHATTPRPVELLAHIVGAQRVWLNRVRADQGNAEAWPKTALKRIGDEIESTFQAWEQQLHFEAESGADRQISYRDSRGQTWSNPVSDIVRHLMYHGAYHRGQIATHLRLAGSESASTDFIVAARTGMIE